MREFLAPAHGEPNHQGGKDEACDDSEQRRVIGATRRKTGPDKNPHAHADALASGGEIAVDMGLRVVS